MDNSVVWKYMAYLIPDKKTETIWNKMLLVAKQWIPADVQSDNGKEFRNKLLDHYFKVFNVKAFWSTI